MMLNNKANNVTGYMNKIISLLLVMSIVALFVLLRDKDTSNENKHITLWVAPNVAQEEFWKIVVNQWNRSGLGTPVSFKTIPATGGAEEAILTALVSDTAPDISTNIFTGFAAQLANLGQLHDLSSIENFEDMVAHRKMSSIMQGWQLQGKNYILPLYSNPTLVWWRKDILDDLGIDKIPTTFNDVYELSRKRMEFDQKYSMKVLAGKEWSDRWFDYIPYYYATGNGASYILDGKAQYDNPASVAALTFIKTMFENQWTQLDYDSGDPLTTGLVAGAVHGPWDISYFRQMFPDILNKIVIGPMIRETDNGSKSITYADSKGLVVFKHSKLKKEAFEFISWFFNHDEFSLLWLEKTGMPPARGDLISNPIFTKFYQTNPLARQYALYVDVAVPPAFIEETLDLHKIMNVEMIEPVKFGTKSIVDATKDAISRTDKLLNNAYDR